MTARHYQLLVLLGAMWGISFVLIKYAIADLSPLATSVWRSIVALAFLSLLWLFTRIVREAWREIRRRPLQTAVLGALQIAIPFTLVHIAEGSIPAGVTGVLVATQTFFIGLLAPVFDASERFTRGQAVGLCVGLVGVAFVVGFQFIDSVAGLIGAFAVIGAAVSYAIGGFVVKLRYGDLDARVTAYVAVAGGALLIAPAGAFTLPDQLPGAAAILATLGIGIIGTALALAIYCHLVREVGAGRAALASYLAPGFALLFAWIILGESLSPLSLVGLVLIVVGVVTVGRQAPRRASETPPLEAPVEVVTAAPRAMADR